MIDIRVMDPRWIKKTEELTELLTKAFQHCIEGKEAEISVVLTGDEFIRILNRTYRGKDAATNVLSFNYSNEKNGIGTIGEVILSFDRIVIESLENNLSFEHHLSHMFIHGVLHILGYSHYSDEESVVMERKEQEILQKLGFRDNCKMDSDVVLN